MKFPSDEEVLQEFRNRPDAAPRSEFLQTLEDKLVNFEKKWRRRQKIRRATIGAGVSAAVVLAVFLLTPIVTQIIQNPDSIVTNQPETPLVMKGQKLKPEEVSPKAKQTLERLYRLVPELAEMEPEVYGKEDGIYAVSFYQMEQGKKRLYASAEIVAHTGKVRSYENEDAFGEDAASPTEEQAMQASAAFLQVLLADEFKQYRASQTSSDDWDAVTYTRYENGLPVFSDRYVVGVNSKGVIYVNSLEGGPLSISSGRFAKPGTVLSAEELAARVASLMELSYSASDRRTGKPSLTYSLQATGFLNAESGEEVGDDSGSKSRYSDPIPVTPGGRKITVQTAKDVAKALAEEFQVNVDGIDFAADEQAPAGDNGRQETVYKSMGGKSRVTVYTENKKIMGFQIRRGLETASSTKHDNHPANPRLSYEEARERAVQYLQPYLDPSVTEVKMDESQMLMPSDTAYSFSFYALHDGVVVSDQHYLVNVDGQTGEIVNFMDYFTTPSAPFPDLRAAISKESAAKKFLQSHPAVLGYMLSGGNEKPEATPLLVFSLDKTSPFLVDAVSGETVE
ncbi:YcdB/YcdC domain-containing protein [Brevibacillus borstelensis]|uniref:YcdB/YcdC domain-containing protein n=1 Tax=Brevibacillus borstelensis TaxID=45462 RepID=UPI0030BB4D8D